MRRPLLRAAPGRIESVRWDHRGGNFNAAGKMAIVGQELILFIHKAIGPSAVTLSGLKNLKLVKSLEPGQIWSATATGDKWKLSIKF